MEKKTTQRTSSPMEKKLFLLLFIALLALLWRSSFLWVNSIITNRLITQEQKKITQLQTNLDNFSQIPWFDKLQIITDLENNLKQIPRSRHIQQVSSIFQDILSTDQSETQNIILSNFSITLDSISVNGYVSNLRILYTSTDPAKRASLIQRFENLPFLNDIKIQNYTRSDDQMGYNFTLTAKVVNNDDE